ncbi:MAG: type VI secretion system tip protein VgrG [Pseudooceanicola sp.]|nr:type VI secretion system tip protein VgrG [Pseudooceanicola sp.]
MANVKIELKGKITELRAEDKLWFTGAIIREKFSELTEMSVEFVTQEPITMKDLVGQTIGVELELNDSKKRRFEGFVTSVERLGEKVGAKGTEVQYLATLRHWLWMLTRTSDNKIFQEKTAVEIIEEIFGEYGFIDFTKKLSATYETREYCVQYRESDYDFISRLMEEEGMYFFFDNAPDSGDKNKLILCDDKTSSHRATPGMAELEFSGSGGKGQEQGNKVTDWASAESVVSGKVTLDDYDMLTPTADQKTVKPTIAVEASHSHKNYEVYHYPGHYRKDTARGTRLATVRMQAEEVGFQLRRGVTNSRNLAIGYTFSLTEGPQGENNPYLVTEAVHYIRPSETHRLEPNRQDRDRPDLTYPKEMESMDYACYFVALKTSVQYRSKRKTPWPTISGLQTAMVVGKQGEEIWTDEHGRIKVQFHWDREGENNENSSCWIRVATPWSGKDWGLVAIPRMGQEVVIQFEEGNPDRPICTGMLWNADTKPAWAYPDNAAQFGMRSRSTKSGGAEEYNEVMFEDKKGEEMMRMQAQKDHQWLIKNKSVTTIGYDELDAGAHDADGCLSEVIKKDVTRTIKEGNHYYTIAKGDEEYKIETGSQLIEIKTDKTQKVEGKYTETITGNMTTEVAQGNQSNTVKMGNQTTAVKMGNIDTKADLGKITFEAMQSIELKVMGSSIKIDPTGVTIKGPMINIEGSGMATMKSPMTTVKGEPLMMVKGGPLVMIN